MANDDSASDKRMSQGSAGWRLTSLWGPISQSILPRSNRTSVQSDEQLAVNFPHISLSIPSLALNRFSGATTKPEVDVGTTALLLDTQKLDIDVIGNEKDDSPSDKSDDFQSALEDIQISRPATALSVTNLPAYLPLGDHDLIRPLSMISLNSHLTKRPESRDIKYLAELPAVPAQLKSVRISRPTILRTSTLPDPEKLEFDVPPAPPKVIEVKAPRAPPKLVDIKAVRNQDAHDVNGEGRNDSGNAVDWPSCGRWTMTFALGFVAFCVALASSITTPATGTAGSHFGMSAEIMTLTTSSFMLGIAVGTFVWTPLHETYGRKPTMLLGLVGFTALQIPVAIAKNVETFLICRFLAGAFGCAPLVAIVVAISDVWTQLDRGVAMSVFSSALIMGTASGPLIGGPIVQSNVLGWRWPSYIVLVLCFPFAFACSLIYRDSSGSILLRRRAKELRRSTGNWALHSIDEETNLTLRKVLSTHLVRPLLMLITDPLLLFPTLHTSFAHGILYLLLETYQLSFLNRRRWPLQLSGLPFAAIIIGVLFGCVINFAFNRFRFAKLYKKYGRFTPEERMLPMAIGGVLLPAGLFLSGWTSRADLTPIPEIIAGGPLGAGILLVCLQGNNYLLDAYTTRSNGPIAISTAVRALFAAGFSAFARPMFNRLGPKWASTILGGVGILLCLIPLIFYRYGVKLRAMSRFTPKLAQGTGDCPTQGRPAGAGEASV